MGTLTYDEMAKAIASCNKVYVMVKVTPDDETVVKITKEEAKEIINWHGRSVKYNATTDGYSLVIG